MDHPMALGYMKMDDQSTGELNATKKAEVAKRTLFTAVGTNFVVRDFYAKATRTLVASESKKDR